LIWLQENFAFLVLFGNNLKNLTLTGTFWAQFRHRQKPVPFYF